MVTRKYPARYRLFGLTVTSTLDIPYLQAVSGGTGPSDVGIALGEVPTTLADTVIRKVFYQLRKSTWLMTAESIAGARFLVRDGREIVVEKVDADHDDDDLRLFLLGSCMGALLLQRGRVPLHGNAIATDKGAIVVAGASGAGKSTTTLALLQRGYRLLADDISAVDVTEGAPPHVQPGFPRLKLWSDTCEKFGIDTNKLSRIRPLLEKFHYPVEDAFCSEPLPLQSVYLLTTESTAQPTLKRLTGIAKMKELQAQLYKMVFTEAQRNWPRLFSQITAIAKHTRICVVRRPANTDICCVDDVVDLIEEDLAA